MQKAKAFLIVAVICCMSGVAFSQVARVAVLNPTKPDMISKGEMGVMLDAVAKSFGKSKQFKVISTADLEKVLKYENLERAGTCPDKQCFGKIADALSLDYIVAVEVEKKKESFDVRLELFEMPSGKSVTVQAGQFTGVKSQLSLKYLPRQAKELARQSEWKAANKQKRRISPVVQSKATEKPAAPKKTAQKEKTAKEPAPTKGGKAKAVFTSPAFWIPTVLAVAVPAAVVYYMRASRGEAEEENGNGGTTTPDEEIPFPDTPTRPSAAGIP